MSLFGGGQVKCDCAAELSRLDGELRKVQALMRALEGEQTIMHDQVRKWMRRAVAAERTVERAEGTEVEPPVIPAETPLKVTAPVWGARARIAARRARAVQPEGASNGVHS